MVANQSLDLRDWTLTYFTLLQVTQVMVWQEQQPLNDWLSRRAYYYSLHQAVIMEDCRTTRVTIKGRKKQGW